MSWKVQGGKAPSLDDPLSLLDGEPELVSGEGTTTHVYRGKHLGDDVFLKVSLRERWKVLAPRLLSARAWCSSVELEARNLLELKRAWIPVIPVLAQGTRYRFGVPVAGLMLSRAVKGESLEDVLNDAHSEQDGMAEKYGRIAAMLHRLGGYEPLRAKDFMVDEGGLVLLDREKPLGLSGWNEKRAMVSLERAWYRNRRSGLRLNRHQSQAWIEGYCNELALSDERYERVACIIGRYYAD